MATKHEGKEVHNELDAEAADGEVEEPAFNPSEKAEVEVASKYRQQQDQFA